MPNWHEKFPTRQLTDTQKDKRKSKSENTTL